MSTRSMPAVTFNGYVVEVLGADTARREVVVRFAGCERIRLVSMDGLKAVDGPQVVERLCRAVERAQERAEAMA